MTKKILQNHFFQHMDMEPCYVQIIEGLGPWIISVFVLKI